MLSDRTRNFITSLRARQLLWKARHGETSTTLLSPRVRGRYFVAERGDRRRACTAVLLQRTQLAQQAMTVTLLARRDVRRESGVGVALIQTEFRAEKRLFNSRNDVHGII